MPRSKKGGKKRQKHKKTIKKAKGYKWGRSSLFKHAKQAVQKAGQHAYRDRKKKKREMRKLWQIRINAAARQHGMKYSELIHQLKENDIELDRKILAQLAEKKPEAFEKLIEEL